MSFGFGIGDVIAVVGLLERVAKEFRSYRDAPSHFQQIGSELHLFRRALVRILEIEPQDDEEKEWLEQVRAIALRCHQPLSDFIDKMRPKENIIGLNHRRRTMALSTVGYRLHWSLIAKKDVEELRTMIGSGMIAINMMLGIQQL